MYLWYQLSRGEGPEPKILNIGRKVQILPGQPNEFGPELGAKILEVFSGGGKAKIVQCDYLGTHLDHAGNIVNSEGKVLVTAEAAAHQLVIAYDATPPTPQPVPVAASEPEPEAAAPVRSLDEIQVEAGAVAPFEKNHEEGQQ